MIYLHCNLQFIYPLIVLKSEKCIIIFVWHNLQRLSFFDAKEQILLKSFSSFVFTKRERIVHRKQISYIRNACYKYFAASKKYAAAMSSKLFLAFNKIWIEFLVFRIIKNYDYDLLILTVSLNTSDSTFKLYPVTHNNNDDAADNIPQTTNDIFLMYTWLYKYIKY